MAPAPPPEGNYIIPTEGELSREPRGFAIDPLGGAADNGRSALPRPVCTAGAFLWPQRRRRRHQQRAAARPALSQVAVPGIPARAQLGLDYIWREGACGQPGGSTCWEACALTGGPGRAGPGGSGRGRGTWPLERDASCLKRGVRASCFTHRLETGHEPTEPRFLPGGWVT